MKLKALIHPNGDILYHYIRPTEQDIMETLLEEYDEVYLDKLLKSEYTIKTIIIEKEPE